MLPPMDAETLEKLARDTFEAALPDDAQDQVILAVDSTRTHHPLWPDVPATADFSVEDDGRVVVTVGAGAASEGELRQAVAAAIEEGLTERDMRDMLGEAEALYETHARFRAGQPTPIGFHRAGRPMGPAAYAVDLDVFVEIRIPAAKFPSLQGRRLHLALDEDGLEIEIPDDFEPDELLTLPDAGLLEADEDLSEEDVMPPAGDLHVAFVLYRSED